MNIQPLGSPAATQLDDRTVAADSSSASGAATATTAATSAATATSATAQADPSAKAAPSRKDVDAAVKKLNDSMSSSSQSLQFSVDHDSKEIVVKLIDQNTGDVLRQIPTPEALQMAKAIDETLDKKQGLLIHQTA
jgi:flagellar protein FlaG